MTSTSPPLRARPRPVRLRLAVACVLIAAVASCDEDSSLVRDTGAPPAAVASVVVLPSSATVSVGESATLHATVRDANGRALSGYAVIWSSSAKAAVVDARGLVTGQSAGDATITATVEGQTGIAAIRVIDFPRPGGTQVLVGAGDIASSVSSAEATAKLLDGIPG